MIGIIKTISQGVSKNQRAFRKVELIEGGSIYIWQPNVGTDIQIGQQYDFTLDGANTSFLNAIEIVPVIGSEVVSPDDTTAGVPTPLGLPLVSPEDKKQAYWDAKDACIKRQSALKSAVAFLRDSTEDKIVKWEDVIACAGRFLKYIEEGE